ncbi:MAG: paraquat-inducible protein A [Oleiphilaceae bacterium]|jgi:paraquat-inducible protein A
MLNRRYLIEYIMISAHKNLISCQDCGHLYDRPHVGNNQQLECKFCNHVMFTNRPDWEHKVTALTLAGIILFILANVFPFIGLETAGQVQNSNLIGGVQALIQREEFLLASIVFITIFLFPLLELLGIFYILLCRFMNIRAPFIGIIVHMLHISKPWGMLEIFLVGVAVASLKLGNFADIILGPGIYAFFGLVLALIANNIYLSREDIWDWLKHENFYSIKEDEDVISCHCCQAHIGISLLEDNNECPRCGTHIHTYQPHSIQKTTALLIAALLLYIPSNLLPIMTTTHLGQVNTDTLMSGVLHLIQSGDIPIAIVVFFASIVVPITKLIVMSYLLWNVSINFTGEPKQMARLYRITEFVGRWSMIDVFVVTTLVALVQFGLLANIEPGGALLCFAGVVVLTMLAAETFDPKLIWNAYENKKHK